VTWTTSGGLLDLLWREHAGPLVQRPTHRGFGMTLITRNLALAFASKVDLEFQPDGIQWRLIAPVRPQSAPPEVEQGIKHAYNNSDYHFSAAFSP
jgi:two-component sensor histidine kinase